jgi:cysteine desulfurase
MDNHATTRVDPRVVEAMLPYFTEDYGNAGSLHAFGEQAREAVERARATIAQAINAEPAEIVFTSGATESNNLALRGVAERPRRRGDHLVSVRTEHKSVLDPLSRLERRGHSLTLLDVQQHGSNLAGRLDPQRVADALRDDTALVSVMLANNEIGVIQPIADIAAICRQRGVVIHCDATQAVGKLPVDVRALGVDLMSFSSHKLYGPKGVGALFVRRSRPGVRLEPQIAGGGQEDGLRSGTLNVPGIVGFATAVELCDDPRLAEMARLAQLRNLLWDELCRRVDQLSLCGPQLDGVYDLAHTPRLPGNLNVAFHDVDGQALMMNMPDVAVSSGAACSSTDPGPSHVLLALGMSEDLARSTLRFGLGRFTTEDDVRAVAAAAAVAVQRVRALA